MTAQARGQMAETLAAWLLRAKLYRILARRLRHPAGEIDILARKGDQLVAVEVKRRGTIEDAAWAISPRQRRRIVRAAEDARARLPGGDRLALRFDVVLIAPGRLPRHLVDAWRP